MSENQPNYIKLNESGEPFASEQAARDFIRTKELDRANFLPRKYQGGWAVYDLEAMTAMASGQMVSPSVPEKPEKYFEVEFTPSGSANDCPHVPLIVGNWDLRVQRGKPVILPERFIEVARHAVHTNYVPDDSASGTGKQPLKAQGTIMRYPFRIIKEATRKEFEEGLAKGNAVQNEWLQNLKRSAP